MGWSGRHGSECLGSEWAGPEWPEWKAARQQLTSANRVAPSGAAGIGALGEEMSASERRKGHDWEREVARKLRPIFGAAHRGIQSREGDEAADVVVPRFHIECKAGRQHTIDGAMRQALAEAKPGLFPVVVSTRRDRRPATVTMTLEDWMELVSQWWKAVNR